MNNKWVRGVLAAVALSLGASALWAQATTGKVEGTVLDPAGQPVNGAQVLILGTSFGTVTDSKGYYFLNNVPAGVYSLRAQFIGLQPAEVRGVRVLVGQTMTVKFSLSAAVQIGGISVIAEAPPIVPRDQVTSKPIVTGETVAALPVDDIRQVLRLQPGVVESNRTQGLSIRGGRAGEAAIYVDGVLVRSVRTGGSRLDVGRNAVEEASITTGALDAEYGDAQSGVISYVTRAGGSRYQGSVSLQSDEPFGDKISVGYNRGEFSFGGPIFGNLTFFIAGTAEGQQSAFRGLGADTVPSYVIGGVDTTVTVARGTDPRTDSLLVDIPKFVQYGGTCDPAKNYGFECQGRRRPVNWSNSGTANAKLQYTYGSGSRVSVSTLLSQNQGRDFNTNGASLFYPLASTGGRGRSNAYILNWVQQVIRGADRALAFDVNLSYQTDDTLGGVLDRDYEITHRDAPLGLALTPMKFLVDFDHFSDDTGPGAVATLKSQADWDQLIRNIRTNTGTRVPYLDRGDLRFAQPYRMNPWAVSTGFPTVGLERTATLGQERRLYGRINMDLQFDRYNRFKFGGEYQKSRVNFFRSNMIRQIFMNGYAESPVRYGAYGEDRIDLGDVVIVLGARWDGYDTRALFPIVPGRIFTSPDFNPADPTSTKVFKQATAHHAISPRVQVSFPVTERTGFRLSYSHQVQTPEFNSMLDGSNNDLSFTNTNDEFGGDVDFGKTILFEFGIRHAFGPDMVLDVSAYNKDKVSDLAYRIQPFFDPLQKRLISMQVLTNADFGNVRGVDLNLIRRISNIFTGSASYTFQIARGTGSDPFSYLNVLSREIIQVTGDRSPPAQALLPTDDNRSHNIAGSLSANFPGDFKRGSAWGSVLQNAGVFATFRFASGLPYTRLLNAGNGQTAPILDCGLACQRAEPINSSTMPWIKSFDLRVNKGLRLGRLDLTLFGDFRNLLNFRNVVELFAETGDIANETYRDQGFVSPELQRLKNDAVASGRAIQVTQGGKVIDAVDLRGSCGSWAGSGGAADCVLLRRAETRFGNNDGIFDANEQTTAFIARYNLFNGEATKLGTPRHIRVGLELNF